jgi:hypothetical protein
MISEAWQQTDWTKLERDEDNALNDARIVGQVWFRGQRDRHGLKPGLYREETWQKLRRTTPRADDDEGLFDELFDLEHEMRVDFASYGSARCSRTPRTPPSMCRHLSGSSIG